MVTSIRTKQQNNKFGSKFLKSLHTEPITLETPGKADVDVVILLSPDDYEICFVGEEGFDDLSAPILGADFIDWEKRRLLGADQ